MLFTVPRDGNKSYACGKHMDGAAAWKIKKSEIISMLAVVSYPKQISATEGLSIGCTVRSHPPLP